MDIKGRVAIVTGGAVRLGRVLVLELARRGARLVIHYHSSASPALEVITQIKGMGGEAIAIQADLRQTAEAQSLITRTAEHFGQLDILVNSAAIFKPGDWAGTTEANWDEHMAINLKAPFFLSRRLPRTWAGSDLHTSLTLPTGEPPAPPPITWPTR